jgi:hypothetical protein
MQAALFTPDTILHWHRQLVANKWYDTDRKKRSNRTELEQKWVDLVYAQMRDRNFPVFDAFVTQNAEPDSFRFLGKDVKIGDGDRLVCAYKLKDSNQYRAIYGDLTAKDINAKVLPAAEKAAEPSD